MTSRPEVAFWQLCKLVSRCVHALWSDAFAVAEYFQREWHTQDGTGCCTGELGLGSSVHRGTMVPGCASTALYAVQLSAAVCLGGLCRESGRVGLGIWHAYVAECECPCCRLRWLHLSRGHYSVSSWHATDRMLLRHGLLGESQLHCMQSHLAQHLQCLHATACRQSSTQAAGWCGVLAGFWQLSWWSDFNGPDGCLG